MSWRRYLPRTLVGLLIAGWVLAGLPLLAAVAISQLSVLELGRQTQDLVDYALVREGDSARLRDGLDRLQNLAREWMIAADPRLQALFTQELAQTQQRLAVATGHDLPAPSARLLGELQEQMEQVERHWREGTPEALKAALARLRVLSDKAVQLNELNRAVADRQAQALQRAAESARQLALVALWVLPPLGMTLAALVLAGIARPLRQLRQGVETLGRGGYQLPVEIAYPGEMAELGRHLDWLRQRLAELEQDQDRFLRNVSHELKTPLTSLIQGLDLLRGGRMGTLGERQMEVVDILGESAEELEHQIANLLAYARWQSERQATEMQWFAIRPVVEEIMAPRKLLLASHGLAVRLDLCDQPLYADRARIKEALDNLVSNAIKHTQRGTAIEISSRIDSELQVLAVRDFGRGVPVKDRRRIFDPFIRGAEREEVGIRGTGIGLTIVRETAHAHAGRVEVQDAKPGAHFVLQWPASVAT